MVQLEAVMVAETMGVAATVEVEQAVEVMEAGAEVAVGLAEGEAVEVVLAVEGLAEEAGPRPRPAPVIIGRIGEHKGKHRDIKHKGKCVEN